MVSQNLYADEMIGHLGYYIDKGTPMETAGGAEDRGTVRHCSNQQVENNG